MILVDSLTNKITRAIFITTFLLITVVLLSPYLVNFYLERQFNNLFKDIRSFSPGIKIVSHFNRKYLKSVLITKIQLDPNIFLDYANEDLTNRLSGYTFSKSIVLRHDINYGLHKKLLATITTSVLDGAPIFIQDNKTAKLVTKLHLNGEFESSVVDLSINRNIGPTKNYHLLSQGIGLHVVNNINNLLINLKIPKLVYNENYDKIEINGLNLTIAAQKSNKNTTQPKVNISGTVNKLYLIEKSTPVLRLTNLNIEQNLADNINTKLGFLKLNILNQKYGPLSTKLQLNNVSLAVLLDKFKHIKFPIIMDQLDKYKFIEIFNDLLKYHPYLSADVLLNVGNDKLKILTDLMVDSSKIDWFSVRDVLTGLSVNVTAKIPKPVLMDFIGYIMYEKQKKILQEEIIYKSSKTNTLAMPKTSIAKDPKELELQLNDMVLERVAYLLENNIILEKDDGFDLDLSIADGNFYSKMNPFKIFSY
jgi:hypothetical protein